MIEYGGSVQRITLFYEMNDFVKDKTLQPENTHDDQHKQATCQHQRVGGLEPVKRQQSQVSRTADAQDQIREENDAPYNDPQDGLGLLREQGGENALVRSVLPARIGIPWLSHPFGNASFDEKEASLQQAA